MIYLEAHLICYLPIYNQYQTNHMKYPYTTFYFLTLYSSKEKGILYICFQQM